MDNSIDDMKAKRRIKLLAYLEKKYQHPISDDVEERSDLDLPENHPNYQFSNWYDEMICKKHYFKDAIREACYEKNLDYTTVFEEEWNKYVTNDELEQRDIAIQEWFEDSGFVNQQLKKDDNSTETLFSDIMDRDKYIWKHRKESNHELLLELANINSRKKELENMLLN